MVSQYLVTGAGTAYYEFLHVQMLAIMVVLAYGSVAIVTSDYRAGGLAFYLSKPISKVQYIIGKALSLASLVAVLTLLPALVLFAEYGFFARSLDYWWDNPRILISIIGFSLLLMTVLSLLAFALGVVCRRAAPLLLAWCGVFLILPVVAALLREIFDKENAFLLFNLWRSLAVVGEAMFGVPVRESRQEHVGWAVAVLVAVSLASSLILLWKVRPVEIVE
jgi:ABC-2 type transport system permease protein